MGKYHARVAVSALLGDEDPAVADHTAIPRVVFTDPQVASVGLTEAGTGDRGIRARAVRVRLENVAAAAANGEGATGAAQPVVDETAT
jgi:pyruvate/2-oxoglutarate dehydrogenase complex dihydrolipoamide dehydrogenase (E3) component